jgi:hypothetical protein
MLNFALFVAFLFIAAGRRGALPPDAVGAASSIVFFAPHSRRDAALSAFGRN